MVDCKPLAVFPNRILMRHSKHIPVNTSGPYHRHLLRVWGCRSPPAFRWVGVVRQRPLPSGAVFSSFLCPQLGEPGVLYSYSISAI